MNSFVRFIILLFILIFSGCSDSGAPEPETPVSYPLEIRAADVSILPEIRKSGIEYKNLDGQIGDALSILQQAGCNTIRLRLWHTPSSQHSSLQEVTEFAAEIKTRGLKLWLAVHYSDTWADPGNQTKPAAWNALSQEVLGDSVYLYTKKIVTLLAPDYIQIGNEINGGFLWPEGNIANTASFIALLKSGVQGVRDAAASTKILIHYAGVEGTTFFYDLLQNNSVNYDIIALSYYPRWHTKSLLTVKSILTQLATNYSKEIILAETAYPFTLGWNDWTNNLVGLTDHLVVGYPATPKGQHDFLMQIRKIVSETNGGIGFSYWAPEWVAYRGEQAEDGSPWENMALFDYEFKALEAIKIFTE